jgi:hypothetical protein
VCPTGPHHVLYITKLMTSVMLSCGALADASDEVHKGHTHTHTHTHTHPRAHAHGHANGICKFMVILCALNRAAPVGNHQVMKAYGETVV